MKFRGFLLQTFGGFFSVLIASMPAIYTRWQAPIDHSWSSGITATFLMHRQIGDMVAMSTQYRIRDKYRIELRERDHLPPHVHLTGGGVDVVINLESVTVTQGRAPARVLKEALAWVAANQADLLKEWMKWHR